MTGGQKSPETPRGAKTKTSPYGSIDEPVKGCELAMATGAGYVARWTTAHPVQLAKAIAEGIEYRGFSFIEVLSQCPVQAGKNVYGEKEPAKILKKYREITYIKQEGAKEPEGKIRIGVLKHDRAAEEYIGKMERKFAEQGIKRG